MYPQVAAVPFWFVPCRGHEVGHFLDLCTNKGRIDLARPLSTRRPRKVGSARLQFETKRAARMS